MLTIAPKSQMILILLLYFISEQNVQSTGLDRPHRLQKVTKHFLDALRTLTEGDEVTLDSSPVCVKYVDRFSRTVTVLKSDGSEETVHASTLSYESPGPSPGM